MRVFYFQKCKNYFFMTRGSVLTAPGRCCPTKSFFTKCLPNLTENNRNEPNLCFHGLLSVNFG